MVKSRQKKNRKKRPSGKTVPVEPQQRTAEFITVGWMLTTLATLAAEVAGLLMAAVLYWSNANWSAKFQDLPGLMLVIACLSGIVGLILCAVASKIREVPAPRAVTQGSVFICILPWLAITARWAAG